MKTAHLIFCLLFLAGLQIWLFAPLRIQPDTETYKEAISLLLAGEGSDRLMRLTKPFALLLPALFSSIQVPVIQAIILQQWLAMACIFWLSHACFRIWLGRAAADKIVLLYAACSPMAVYGWAAITDSLGWALTWALLYFISCQQQKQQSSYFSNTPFSLAFCATFGAALAAAIFAKESVLVAGLFFFWLVALSPAFSFLQKVKAYAASGAAFLLVLAAGLWATRLAFGYNLLDWFAFNHDDEAALYPQGWLLPYLVQTARTLDVLWFFVPLGLLPAYRNPKPLDAPFLAAFLTAFAAYPFVWAYMSDRIIFMFAPFCLYFVARGQEKNRFGFFGVAAAVAACLACAVLSYLSAAQGGLLIIYAAFALFFVAAVWPKFGEEEKSI